MKRIVAGGVALGVVAVAGWQGVALIAASAQTSQALPPPVPKPTATAPPAVRPKPGSSPAPRATVTSSTPMAQRVAVLGLLNKRNGASRDLTLKPGQAIRIGEVVVRLRACEQTAPWEQEPLTGAFVQMEVEQVDHRWRRAFSGWLYKERPALNVVQHPVYDVWTKSCTMAFPSAGPETVPVTELAPRSSAKKSPGTEVSPPAEAPTTPDSAAESNAT